MFPPERDPGSWDAGSFGLVFALDGLGVGAVHKPEWEGCSNLLLHPSPQTSKQHATTPSMWETRFWLRLRLCRQLGSQNQGLGSPSGANHKSWFQDRNLVLAGLSACGTQGRVPPQNGALTRHKAGKKGRNPPMRQTVPDRSWET